MSQLVTLTLKDVKYPIAIKHTPGRLANDILKVNNKMKYSQITVVGVPGSGKTTCVQCITHAIHKKDPSYSIHHFYKDDILKMDKILTKLPKQQNCILIFDDISYLFEQLSEKETAQILHDLTIIREKLDPQFKQTRCIVFLMFHYSFGLIKGMRQANFRIMCSITDEERDNYKKILGYSRQKDINDFVRKFLSMMRYDNFKLRLPDVEDPITYHTDRPFRVALVSNLGELHYSLYHHVNCATCAGKGQIRQPDTEFWRQMMQSYSFSDIANNLTKYCVIRRGLKVGNRVDRSIFRQIQGQDVEGRLPAIEIYKAFAEAKKIKVLEALDTKYDTKATEQKRREAVIESIAKLEDQLKHADSQTINIAQDVPSEALQGTEENIYLPEDEEEQDDDDNDDFAVPGLKPEPGGP